MGKEQIVDILRTYRQTELLHDRHVVCHFPPNTQTTTESDELRGSK